MVQFDFLVQVQRDARAEFAIPGSSKSTSGQTGFADIVSIATGEIWEIKPERLEDNAVKEASRYAKFAKVACGSQWRPGTSYSTTNLFGGGGVVYRLEGNGNKAELIAYQGRPGAVLYKWRINGSEVSSLIPYFAWALRQQIVKDYFAVGQPQPLPGAKPPNNLPPPKYKPPVLTPDGCIPQLGPLLPEFIRSIRSICAQTVLDGSSVAILLNSAVFNAIFGPGIVANQIAVMQVKADPVQALQRTALTMLIATVGIPGAIAAGWLVVEALPLAAGVIGLVVRVGGTVAAGGEGALGSLFSGLSNAVARTAVTVGSAVVAFVIPRASMADSKTPVAFDVSIAKFVVIPPGRPAPRVGLSVNADGGDWVVAGLARTPPD
ncbi:hypothetical protein ABZN20_03495 [Methylococcus sp. ANG]|uniref:hypothetical protein n=1 Tax=Methylococcus sp. ANG TaxID=3231903 RepID=UPI00345A6986